MGSTPSTKSIARIFKSVILRERKEKGIRLPAQHRTEFRFVWKQYRICMQGPRRTQRPCRALHAHGRDVSKPTDTPHVLLGWRNPGDSHGSVSTAGLKDNPGKREASGVVDKGRHHHASHSSEQAARSSSQLPRARLRQKMN